MSRPFALLSLLLLIVSSGCVGALEGGTLSFDSPRYWAAVDVAVVTPGGAPVAGIRVSRTTASPSLVRFAIASTGSPTREGWSASR